MIREAERAERVVVHLLFILASVSLIRLFPIYGVLYVLSGFRYINYRPNGAL